MHTKYFENNLANVLLQMKRSREPGRFPQGETVVKYTATDDSGNSASCNITINVQSKNISNSNFVANLFSY